MPNTLDMVDFLRSARAKMRLERRLFLKALALGLSAPVAWRLIQNATAAPGDKPKRFLLYYMPHGVPPEHFASDRRGHQLWVGSERRFNSRAA